MHSDVCRIPLGTRGLYDAIVDTGDYAALAQWRWNWKRSRGGGIYARRGGGRIRSTGALRPTILMHVFILETLKGEPRPSPEHTPDHINRNSLDNRRDNLKWATRREQGLNQRRGRKSALAAEKRREILRELAESVRRAA